MEKSFNSNNDQYEFDGKDGFQAISLHTNKSFATRKVVLILKINGEYHSTIERKLSDPNEFATTLEYQSQEAFKLSFEGIEKDETVVMRFDIVEPARFLNM